MNRFSVFVLLWFVPSAIGAAQASNSTGQAELQNLVTVSFNTVVLQTAEAQKRLAALQTRLAPKEDHLKALNTEVEGIRKQLAANSILSDLERTGLERSLESKEKQLQRDAEDFKTDSQSESEQVFQGVAQKVYVFLQTFSRQHGYTAVIERGSDSNPVVWYAAARMDITDEVIKAYNAQSGDETPKHINSPARDDSTPSKPLPDSPSRK